MLNKKYERNPLFLPYANFCVLYPFRSFDFPRFDRFAKDPLKYLLHSGGGGRSTGVGVNNTGVGPPGSPRLGQGGGSTANVPQSASPSSYRRNMLGVGVIQPGGGGAPLSSSATRRRPQSLSDADERRTESADDLFAGSTTTPAERMALLSNGDRYQCDSEDEGGGGGNNRNGRAAAATSIV